MTIVLGEGIDLLILSVFYILARRRARTRLLGFSDVLSKNMTSFGRRYRFIDFIDFFHFRSGVGEDTSTGVLQCAEQLSTFLTFEGVITEMMITADGYTYMYSDYPHEREKLGVVKHSSETRYAV
ncbi:hypothetical protein Y032_0167g118 [Ancylostoma ceylanicum]|uniref:Uncharacterized protein n=1 Tax=Ancylostoma ceylanicum TaxID=53326 RepID=A0A016SWH1_9BILA|nr:hypothetical protein Y032_0167g118 [Ancylostoma ceylanicum]